MITILYERYRVATALKIARFYSVPKYVQWREWEPILGLKVRQANSIILHLPKPYRGIIFEEL